jgi:hypothetical protein
VLDQAGAIELIRMARDGAMTGRVRLPAEPGFDDVVAFGGGMLALGRDQVVAWYDARGAMRGRVTPLPGEFLVELTARRGKALVGIGKMDRAAVGVRLLGVGGGALRWGAYTHLPDPLRGLALSPDHRRVAGIRADVAVGQVIELGGPRIVEDDLVAGSREEPATIGFLAGGAAVMISQSVIRRSANDQISIGPDGATAPAVFGDGIAVAARGQGLVLVDRARRRFLGYREVGAGPLRPAGAHFAMDVGYQLLWLDGRLAATRATDEPGNHLRFAIDDRLLVELVREPRSEELKGLAPTEVAIRDIAEDATNSLGTWPGVDDVKFDPRSRVLAISAGLEAHRFVVGPRGAARPLPSLTLANPLASVYPLDPAVAHGAVAVALRGRREQGRPELEIETHRERGPPARGAVVGKLLGVDETGAVWVTRDRTIAAVRDGAEVVRVELALATPIEDGAPSPGGAFAVVRGAHEVIAVDAAGGVRWRREILQAQHLAISGDGATVAVATPAGLIALDAATGARRAWACGWHFGLYDVLGDGGGVACRPD